MTHPVTDLLRAPISTGVELCYQTFGDPDREPLLLVMGLGGPLTWWDDALCRRLADEGARIIFVPFCTDSRQGYLRVRYCAQARAIENQCFTVLSGNVGNLPNVANMDIQYAQSCILTPCDFPFARDGIAAEASENVEMVTVADLNLATLAWARYEGSVRNFRDRRLDLYRTTWSDGG